MIFSSSWTSTGYYSNSIGSFVTELSKYHVVPLSYSPTSTNQISCCVNKCTTNHMQTPDYKLNLSLALNYGSHKHTFVDRSTRYMGPPNWCAILSAEKLSKQLKRDTVQSLLNMRLYDVGSLNHTPITKSTGRIKKRNHITPAYLSNRLSPFVRCFKGTTGTTAVIVYPLYPLCLDS